MNRLTKEEQSSVKRLAYRLKRGEKLLGKAVAFLTRCFFRDN